MRLITASIKMGLAYLVLLILLLALFQKITVQVHASSFLYTLIA